MAETKDCWAEWVGRMRPGEEEDEHPHHRWRERVLDAAEPIAGQSVLDVGCGEGLIAFGALARGAREAIFADISRDLLEHCRSVAAERAVLDRCRFVHASAEDLAGVPDASVDVVTTRSVLIYVPDKRAAFREFSRVLRPGGRISLFEPINRFTRTDELTWAGYDLRPVADVARKLLAVYEAIQPSSSDPMLDFDERDLLALAEGAGFSPIRLVLEAEIRPHEPESWETFLDRRGNPRIPTIAEAMEQALPPEDRERVVAHLRPLVESGSGTYRMALAFLSATKPSTEGV